MRSLNLLNLFKCSVLFQVDLPNNITLIWDGQRIGVDTPESLRAEYPNFMLYGLLGTYNNNTADDFIGPDGKLRNSSIEFGNSWVVSGSCPAPAKKKGSIQSNFNC